MRILRRILIGWLWHTWRYRLTRAGKLVLLAIVCAWAPALPTIDLGFVHLITALCSLFLLSLGYVLVFRPVIRIQGMFPEQVEAGETFIAQFTLENRSKRAAWDVALGFWGLPSAFRPTNPDAILACLAPRRPVTVRVELCALRRGYYELPDVRAFTLFPFHLFRRTAGLCRVPPILVLPHRATVEDLDLSVGSPEPSEECAVARAGYSTEYMSSRDYHPGDPTRRLDFRAMARRGRPVIREYQDEQDCHVAVVLDTFVSGRWKSRKKGLAALEAAISLSASIVDALPRGRAAIRAFANGPELHGGRADERRAFHGEILEILACTRPCRVMPFRALGSEMADILPSLTTVFFVLLDWDEAREDLVLRVAEAGVQTRVFVVRDGPTSAPFNSAGECAGPITVIDPGSLREGGREET